MTGFSMRALTALRMPPIWQPGILKGRQALRALSIRFSG
jgi:hypothetical protein